MGLYTKFVLFYFLNFALTHGQNNCPSSYCGSSSVRVQYPFKFENTTPSSNSINCTYFNLSCNIIGSTILVNLPHAGDFNVKKIDYAQQHIQLYDPDNCLMRRLSDSGLHLQSSPFMAEFDNYTFYVCPVGSSMYPIHCMSNSTYITIATRDSSSIDYRCKPIGSQMLPVELDHTFFYLSWDSNHCTNKCKQEGPKLIAKIVALALTLPGLIIMGLSCCSVFCFHLMKMMGDGAAEAAPPTTAVETVNTGLDESKIVGCIELVIVGERDGDGGSNSKTCSICLENYSEKETVSVISKCGHCFHANCIHQWLGKNATCPVCRTSLCDFI